MLTFCRPCDSQQQDQAIVTDASYGSERFKHSCSENVRDWSTSVPLAFRRVSTPITRPRSCDTSKTEHRPLQVIITSIPGIVLPRQQSRFQNDTAIGATQRSNHTSQRQRKLRNICSKRADTPVQHTGHRAGKWWLNSSTNLSPSTSPSSPVDGHGKRSKVTRLHVCSARRRWLPRRDRQTIRPHRRQIAELHPGFSTPPFSDLSARSTVARDPVEPAISTRSRVRHWSEEAISRKRISHFARMVHIRTEQTSREVDGPRVRGIHKMWNTKSARY